MELLCIGLSHKSAPVSVRERLALSEDRQLETLKALQQSGAEAFLVSTCNRVEFYVAGQGTLRSDTRNLIASVAGTEALDHLYEHEGDAALTHLFRVSSSLDSMVLGEPQILGQVKEAYELARSNGLARGELSRACQAAFASAKRVRSETGIGRAAISMASAAVSLAQKMFGSLSGRTVLLVGAGEVAELAARHLKTAGASNLYVINRTLSRAEALAADVGAQAKPFEDLIPLLVPADVVICSTASPTPILTAERVAPILKARKFRPLFMVDLAVPRDIDPPVGKLAGVYAYDVDDIQKVVHENEAARASEAARAEVIISEEISRFIRDKGIRDGVPVLAALRARADQIARSELEKTLSQIGEALTEKQRRSVEAMASAIVNKILHPPTAKLRAVGAEDDANRLAGAAAELFGLAEGRPTVEPAAESPSEGDNGTPSAVRSIKG
ncbi:MAG: glutamyl-tRNA reductase [Myxococcaceae bacterium]